MKAGDTSHAPANGFTTETAARGGDGSAAQLSSTEQFDGRFVRSTTAIRSSHDV